MEPEHSTDADVVMPEGVVTDQTPKPRRRWWLYLGVFIATKLSFICVLVGLFYFLQLAPAEFTPQTITIEAGESALSIAQKLTQQQVVQSQYVLFAILRYWQDPTQIKATTFTFDEPQTAFEIAELLVEGEFGNNLVAVTFIEGESLAGFATRAAAVLESFDATEFAQLTVGLEGQLFPETYRVPADFTTTELVRLLQETHDQVITELLDIYSTTLSELELVTLASIVEREANTPESMALVSGVFNNRLAIGMPLQADASIEYVLETPLGQLPAGQLAVELRELDSPYNTYLYAGLPPTPIGNPGRIALEAVLNPTASDYFFYLTDDNGDFYYAETYDQHLTNIAMYLR